MESQTPGKAHRTESKKRDNQIPDGKRAEDEEPKSKKGKSKSAAVDEKRKGREQVKDKEPTHMKSKRKKERSTTVDENSKGSNEGSHSETPSAERKEKSNTETESKGMEEVKAETKAKKLSCDRPSENKKEQELGNTNKKRQK